MAPPKKKKTPKNTKQLWLMPLEILFSDTSTPILEEAMEKKWPPLTWAQEDRGTGIHKRNLNSDPGPSQTCFK